MSVELIKYAFSAGELSKTLYGRSDLTKFDLGVALGYNWFVDYRGGLSTRPGTRFIDYVPAEDKPTKLFTFRFSPALADNYVMLFGHHYMIPIQNGGYVVEDNRVFTLVSLQPNGRFDGVTTDWIVGDWVKVIVSADNRGLVSRTMEINTVDGTGVRLTDLATKQPLDTSALTAGPITLARITRVSTPYPAEDLEELSLFQIRDTCRMTHPRHPIRNLMRGETVWEITEEKIGNVIQRPTGLAAAPSSSGDASMIFAVTAVNKDGIESAMSNPYRVTGSVNYTTTAGSIRFAWQPVTGAVEYRVYRSPIVGVGGPASYGAQLGYLGSTKTTEFIDPNIIPDFTKSPPFPRDPFAPGAITELQIQTVGTGFNNPAAINATGAGGSGFEAYGLPDRDNKLVNTVIVKEGKGYPQNTTITPAAGSGAVIKPTISPLTGTYPSISCVFQQRQIYAASLNEPLTLWASQVKQFNVFDDASLIVASDSYQFEIDSTELSPIKHMFSMRGGLLLLSQTGVWMLTGGSNQQAVTPTNALADPQSYTGVSEVVPLKIGPDLLYVEGKGYSVRLLSYNDFSKIYSGEDKSILSNHLFGPDRKMVKWAYAENPYKTVWGVRQDGAIVCLTAVKEQEVYGWTWGQTKGLFTDIVAVQEDDFDYCYVTITRFINGMWRKYVERIESREFNNIEDAWCSDCALKLEYGMTAQGNDLTVSTEFTEGDIIKVTLTTVNDTFSATRNGYVVRAAGGIFRVSEFIDEKTVKANVVASATEVIPEDPLKRVMPVEGGEWTYSQPTTTIYGLSHLEGEEVVTLGDGNVMVTLRVTDGKITLPHPVTKAIIGLSYQCIVKTLPATTQQAVIEAKRKRFVGVGVRLNDSRGLEYGTSLDRMWAMKERTNEPYGVPTRTVNGIKYLIPSSEWKEDAQMYFVQNKPLPSTILGLVSDMEIGDDSD